MSLPCVRGGGRRGTSLTEGLLHTRESDVDTPSASHSFGTSLTEEGKGARARTRHGGGRGSCAGQEKRVRVQAIARRKGKNFTPSASHSFGTSLHEGGKGARASTRQGKRVRVRAIARRKRKSYTPSASRSFGTSLVEGGKGMAGGLLRILRDP